MKLKQNVASLDSVPEAFRSLYVKNDEGSFDLDVEDNATAGLKTKLSEFRTNNIKLQQDYEKAQADLEKFAGIDPTKYAAAQEAMERIEQQAESDLIKAGKFDVLRQKWTEGATSPLKKQLGDLTAAQKDAADKLAAKSARLNDLLLEQQATKVFGDIASVRQGAMTDVMNRVKSAFKMGDDESPVAVEGITDDDGKPLNLEGFGRKLLKEAAYLFEGSGGGGGGGGQKQKHNNKITTIASDPLEIGRNLEGLAKGTVTVAGT